MWKMVKTVVGIGIGIYILIIVGNLFVLPIATSRNPGQVMDRTSQGFLNWLASPGPGGGDARVVSIALVFGLILLFLWGIRKIKADTKKTFSKPQPHKKKPKRYEIVDDDDGHGH